MRPAAPRAPTSALLLLAALPLLATSAACHRHEQPSFRLDAPIADDDVPRALAQGLGVTLRPGHRITRVDDGAVFDVIEDAIAHAQSSIHVLAYIWKKGAASDRVVAAITARARAGVRCRILVDAFGSSDFAAEVRPTLAAAGCDARIFRPIPGTHDAARNHRKIVVVDGRIGITGGFGVRDDWLGNGVDDGQWHDTNVRVTGPAVADMQQAFAENWQEAGGPLLPPDAFPPIEPDGPSRAAFVASSGAPVLTRAERLTQIGIASAKRRLWIRNAYFVPTDAIFDLLGAKAKGGVDVRLLTPGKKSDSKPSFFMQQKEYGSLVDEGVRVWEYPRTMMHAKTMVVDDRYVVVGSINLDPLSLHELEEGALVVDDPAVAADFATEFLTDAARSNENHAKSK